MSITKDDVQKVANLARLHMDEADLEATAQEIDRILRFAGIITQVDTTGVEASAYGLDMQNVFREDTVTPSYDRDLLLQGAPDHEDGQFLVPKVV